MKIFTRIYFLTTTKVSQQNKIYITNYKLQKKKNYTQVTKNNFKMFSRKKKYHENDIVVIV